jgi:hypothetical protein
MIDSKKDEIQINIAPDRTDTNTSSRMRVVNITSDIVRYNMKRHN